jgi:predicted dehydrogenase
MGAGRWGANLVRVCRDIAGGELAWVIDPAPEARRRARALAPGARVAARIESAIEEVDAVVVCTPAREHEEHVKWLLGRGVDVMVEKPFAMSSAAAEVLEAMAEERGAVLMVGHQLLFHPAFERLRLLLDGGAIGAPKEISAARIGPMDVTKEGGVIHGFGPHDVAMLCEISGERPADVRARPLDGATASSRLSSARITVEFQSGLVADIELRAADGDRVRRFEVRGDGGTLVFDDRAPPGKLMLLGGSGAAKEQPLKWREPLVGEVTHFLHCVATRVTPLTGPAHARRVTAVLERAVGSLRTAG